MNSILDWAGQRGNWWPLLAGFLVPFAVIAGTGHLWFWLPAGTGLIMTAIRPAGTSLRHRQRVRQALNQFRPPGPRS